jgi:integrase
MNTGLRVGDASRLRVDCLVHDGQGAPYLRYTNHKMRRDAFVPVDTELAEAITAQQHAVLTEFAEAVYLLPRPTRNPDGKLPFSTATFRGELREWLQACNIRDELGRPVHVTPHQWRHTYGTRLNVCGIASDASFGSRVERCGSVYLGISAIRGLGRALA